VPQAVYQPVSAVRQPDGQIALTIRVTKGAAARERTCTVAGDADLVAMGEHIGLDLEREIDVADEPEPTPEAEPLDVSKLVLDPARARQAAREVTLFEPEMGLDGLPLDMTGH
jgi:hypothetical protein